MGEQAQMMMMRIRGLVCCQHVNSMTVIAIQMIKPGVGGRDNCDCCAGRNEGGCDGDTVTP